MIVRFRNVPSCKGCTQLINLAKVTNIAITEGPTSDDYRIHINFGAERILIRDKMSSQECNNFMNTIQMFWMDGMYQEVIPELNCAARAVTPPAPIQVEDYEDPLWTEPVWTNPNEDEE